MERDWKEEIGIERKAQVSTVVIVETEDRFRIKELIEAVKTRYVPLFASKEAKHVVKADPWEGLIDLRTGDRIEGEGASFPFAEPGLIGQLRQIDRMVKSETTAVFIMGITNSDLAKSVSIALQNWAYHDRVFEMQSTIFVITPDSELFDEYTRKCSIVVAAPFSTAEERRRILKEIIHDLNTRRPDLNLQYDEMVVVTGAGLTLHDFESVVLKSISEYRAVRVEATTAHKMKLMKKYGFTLTYPKLGWEAIGGYETLKEYIKQNIINIIRDEKAREWGVGATRGILMFGIGGTGKSLFAKVMAKELGLPFIKVSSADLFRGIVGETERRVRQLQKVAEENAPCIVFVDEIDQLGLRRDMVAITDSGVSRRVTNMLMDWLGDDERKSIIVGATNVIEQLDPAFMRAGRFDDKIPFFPPDFEARKEIIKVHTSVVRKIPSKLRERDLDIIAKWTKYYTGAEIERLCLAAARLARACGDDYVTLKHFEAALDEASIDLNKRQKELEEFINTAKAYASNKRLLRLQMEEFKKKEAEADARLQALLKSL